MLTNVFQSMWFVLWKNRGDIGRLSGTVLKKTLDQFSIYLVATEELF